MTNDNLSEIRRRKIRMKYFLSGVVFLVGLGIVVRVAEVTTTGAVFLAIAIGGVISEIK